MWTHMGHELGGDEWRVESEMEDPERIIGCGRHYRSRLLGIAVARSATIA